MRRSFITIIILFCSLSCFCQQNNDTADVNENVVFTPVEIDAKFSNDKHAWDEFLKRNIDTTIYKRNKVPNGIYSVDLKFKINKDGTVYDIKSATNVGYGLEEEAVRVMKLSPKWIPAMQNGRIVPFSYKTITINFIVK